MTERADVVTGSGPAVPGGQRGAATALGLVVLLMGLRLAQVWSSDPDLGHGWLVGCFFIWWALERWRDRPGLSDGESPEGRARPLGAPGPATGVSGYFGGPSGPALPLLGWMTLVGGLAVLVPVRLLLTPYPYWPGLLWIWCGGLAMLALIGLARSGGRSWVRHFGFGVILIAVALPWPQVLQRAVFEPTRVAITAVAAEGLNWVGYPTVVHGTTLQVVGRWVGMEEACAGLRALQLALALAVMVGEAVRMRCARRLITVGFAVGVAVVANFGRVLFLSWRAAKGAPAEDPLHDASGYLAYVLLAAVLGVVGWRWRRSAERGPSEPVGNASQPSPRPAVPEAEGGGARQWWLAVAGGVVVLEAGAMAWFSAATGGWQPTWQVQLPDRAPYFTTIPLAASAREMLQPDHYAGGSWLRRDGLTRVVFYAEWQRGQQASHVPFVHNPTVCFPYAGCRLEEALGPIDVAVAGRSVTFQGYRFTRAGQRIVAYYTVWDADRQQLLADARPSAGWAHWWLSRWAMVTERRSQIRAQLLTVAVMGDAERMELAGPAFLKREIEAVIGQVP